MKTLLVRLYIQLAFLLLTLLAPHQTRAADSLFVSKRVISVDSWQKLTTDSSFNYKNVKENEVPLPKPEKYSQPNPFITGLIRFLSSTVGKICLWGFIAFIVLFALYKIFIADKTAIFSKTRKVPENPESTNEEDINSNWELLMQHAIKANNLRLAVRYSYLYLLQMLQKNELIQYRSDKTNYDYYRELADTGYKQPFQRLTRAYEYAWYGHSALTPATFDEYMNTFNVFKEKLS